MNLLFDFITAQVKTGAGEYQRRVFLEVYSQIKSSDLKVNVFALYDSRVGIAYEDLRPETFGQNNEIKYVDISAQSLKSIVDQYQIDKLFIACGQAFADLNDMKDIKCEIIASIHDTVTEDCYIDKIYMYTELVRLDAEAPVSFPRLRFLGKLPSVRRYLDKFDHFSLEYIKKGGNHRFVRRLRCLKPIVDAFRNGCRVKIVTGSMSTKYALMFHYGFDESDISVLWSPERLFSFSESEEIQAEQLRELINSGKKYFFMVSANRPLKNFNKLMRAFAEYSKTHKEFYLVTSGAERSYFDNHISLPFLGENDFTIALKNSYAFVFPSMYEGFGYPPVEAMKFGKPVLSSNASDMPTILGDAAIYFCPFYTSSIYAALCKLNETNYQLRSESSTRRYAEISARQEADLEPLLDMILG